MINIDGKQQLINISKCVLYTTISGLFIGSLVSIFNYLAVIISGYSGQIYGYISDNLWYIPLVIMVLLIFALIMSRIQKSVPETVGSGIPQMKGAIKGVLTFKWLRLLIATFFNSMISFFIGLSLGAAGPSIQLSGTMAKGVGRMLRTNPHWDRYMIRGGASAGLATAFNAPLTGIIFGIEETHDHFTPLIFIATLCSVMSAILVSQQINFALNIEQVYFFINITYAFNITEIYYPILLGIIIGISSILFNKILLFSKDLTNRIKIPQWLKLFIVFLIIGISNIFFIQGAGSGHNVLDVIGDMNFTWKMLLLLLFVKGLFTVLSFDSGATGGMFFPMLTLGAIIGGLSAEGFLAIGMPKEAYNTIVICSMAAFLGAISRTPLTAIIAIIETTSFKSGFIAPLFTVCIAYILIELSQTPSMYDSLLKSYLLKLHEKKNKEVLTLNIRVETHSFVDGKYIKDILWPQNCFILHIVRDGIETAVKGDTLLKSDDVLTVQTTTYNPKETTELINDLCTYKKR